MKNRFQVSLDSSTNTLRPAGKLSRIRVAISSTRASDAACGTLTWMSQPLIPPVTCATYSNGNPTSGMYRAVVWLDGLSETVPARVTGEPPCELKMPQTYEFWPVTNTTRP